MLHHSIFYQNKSILKYYVTIRKLQRPPNKIDNFDIDIKKKSYVYIYIYNYIIIFIFKSYICLLYAQGTYKLIWSFVAFEGVSEMGSLL